MNIRKPLVPLFYQAFHLPRPGGNIFSISEERSKSLPYQFLPVERAEIRIVLVEWEENPNPVDSSREAAIECSPRRKPWVANGSQPKKSASPRGAKENSARS